jgi:aryl-alcohol dehydrogenase-like predicted oxidoreductase
LPQNEVNNIIHAAIDLGINLIDTADVYTKQQSEITLGNALKGRWDKVVLATKAFFPVGEGPNDRGTSRYHLLNTVDASLTRLQGDHIDLFYVHRWDETTPLQETLRTLDDLVRWGKVRYLGASEFASWQLAHANLLAELKGWTPFVALQSHYNMFKRDVEGEILPYCRAHGVGFIPYFPLAGGFLTGKYERGQPAPSGSRGESNQYVQGLMTDANYTIVEKLSAWAADHGRGMNELAQAWLLAHPEVSSVISGSTKLAHVQSNVKAADWALSENEVAEVNAILDRTP